MTKPIVISRLFSTVAVALTVTSFAALMPTIAEAKKPRKAAIKLVQKPPAAPLPGTAALVVHMNSGETLIDDQGRAHEKLYPASLTKMMTLALLFDALDHPDESQRIHLSDHMTFSSRAARSGAFKIGLPAGSQITVQQAIEAVIAYSANDAAVVIAEHLAGSEADFAELMTLKAHALGMKDTTFKNASGWPDKEQVSTAADMAILAQYLIGNKNKYYDFFKTNQVTINGRTYNDRETSAQSLMSRIPGLDGLKSGWIRASGSNVVTSIMRGGERLIVVVLGGSRQGGLAGWGIRNNKVEQLTNQGFEMLTHRKMENNQIVPKTMQLDGLSLEKSPFLKDPEPLATLITPSIP